MATEIGRMKIAVVALSVVVLVVVIECKRFTNIQSRRHLPWSVVGRNKSVPRTSAVGISRVPLTSSSRQALTRREIDDNYQKFLPELKNALKFVKNPPSVPYKPPLKIIHAGVSVVRGIDHHNIMYSVNSKYSNTHCWISFRLNGTGVIVDSLDCS